MRKKWLGYLFAGIGFFSLTFIMTYPLGLEMGSAINDTEDSLLNTWILSWDVNQIKNFNFSHFFDANFFYPHKKVLAYSEHLFSLSVIALPVKLLFNNPILAYNFTLLFAFFMCGFGMYLLAYHITGDHWASFAGGIIYAFAPYKFAQLCHLQVVSAWAIPLSFLYLQKYFANYRFRYLLLLTFFFLFQILGNGYFALYLTLFLGFAILYTIVAEKRYHDRKLMAQLIFFVLFVLLVAAPFFYPYFVVRREMNFMRNELFWADISSYLASGPLNFLYGKITSPLLRPEGELFPGLTAVFLGYVGLRSVSILKTEDVAQEEKSRDFKRLNKFINILILFFLLIAIIIVITGGTQGTLWGIPFSAKTPKGFIFYILVVVLIRLIYDRDFRRRVKRKLLGSHDTNLRIYFWMGMLSFLFTLGPEIHFFNIEVFPFGPYELLKIFIPGFDGLRVSSRFFIFVLLSLAVFSSIGFKVLKNQLMNNRFRTAIVLVPILLLTEYLSIPTPLFPVQVNNQIPNVYQWLGKQKKDFSIIELPLPKPWITMARIEAPRVYFSSYHWKKLFNGYSGYFPPVYVEMMYRFSKGPLKNRLLDIEALGINYIILHLDQFDQKEGQNVLEDLTYSNQGKFVARFDNDHVFELSQRLRGEGADCQLTGTRISAKEWVLGTNVNPEFIDQVKDGQAETYWGTGRSQTPGDFIVVDFRKPVWVNGISLKLGEKYYQYPRGYQLEGSMDGRNWFTIARQDSYLPPITIFLKPRAIFCPIHFSVTKTRFLRMTNTQFDESEWAVSELEIFSPRSQ